MASFYEAVDSIIFGTPPSQHESTSLEIQVINIYIGAVIYWCPHTTYRRRWQIIKDVNVINSIWNEEILICTSEIHVNFIRNYEVLD